jgi:hypothetical protein
VTTRKEDTIEAHHDQIWSQNLLKQK